MGKMKDLHMDLSECYYKGMTEDEAAEALGVSVETVFTYYQELAEQTSYDESMDGDFDSGMASAGFGTDEDYGSCSEY